MPTIFEQRVYDACKMIPRGKVSTYKEIGKFLGISGQGFRAVGRALNKNPFAPIIPCHRVVSSNGGIGGFAWGSDKKAKMLMDEGVKVKDGKIVDFESVMFRFLLYYSNILIPNIFLVYIRA